MGAEADVSPDHPTHRRDADSPASPEIVMFFLGPDGEPSQPEPEPTPRTLGEIYRTWRTALAEERDREEFNRTRPVARQVHGTGRPGKAGFRDEIVVTIRSSPMEAVAEALTGAVFDPPIPRLSVDESSLRASRYELSWHARIRVSPWLTRDARLRLYASPSLNVSVLSLFPLKQRPIAKSSFLRKGLRVMNALGARIDERVADREI